MCNLNLCLKTTKTELLQDYEFKITIDFKEAFQT